MDARPDPTRDTVAPRGVWASRLTSAVALPWLLGGASLALALFAYRALLAFRPTTSVTLAVEGWFFEPADTSPLLIVLLAGWLAWRRRRRLARLELRAGPWPVTALLLAAGCGSFAWALLAQAPDLLALSLLANAMGLAHALGGRRALGVLALPCLVLLFALPVPSPLLNHVVWWFQIHTANTTGLLLYLLGKPALVAGDRIIQPERVFAIIETCSGLRSVETLLLLSALMIDLFGRRGWHAVLLLAAAPPVAFAINSLRAVALILTPHSDIASIHSAQGIAMLLGGVLALYGFDGLLERLLPRPPADPDGPRAGAARPVLRPRLAGTVALLGGLAVLSLALSPWRLPPLDPPLPTDVVPRTLGQWTGTEKQTDWLFFGKTGFRQVVNRRYVRGPEHVDLFLASGARERRFRSLFSPKTEVPGSGWIVEKEGRSTRDGHDVDWKVVRRGSDRRLLRHWYQGAHSLGVESLRVLLALDTSPFRLAGAPVAVRLSTPMAPGPHGQEAAEARLDAFAKLLEEPLAELRAAHRSDAPGSDAPGRSG